MACPFLENPIDEGAKLLRRELNIRREMIFKPRMNILSFPDKVLTERYRFTLESIRYLVDLIGPYISHRTRRGRALTAEQTLCVALRFFTNGSFLYNVGDSERISKSTVSRSVRSVCLALKKLSRMFIVFPGHKPVSQIKEEFHKIAGFPSVIGCIDGTHVHIKSPAVSEGDYINRKSTHSINVQIACDASQIITNVDTKWPGSIHESKIFPESSLNTRFERGEFDGFLLGDRAYQCNQHLLTPYADPKPGPQQHFNEAHSRTIACVQNTIELLKTRFQCLHHLRVTPERARDIIVACVVLHNIAIIKGEKFPARHEETADEDPIRPADLQEGKEQRDAVCRSHFSS
ncbi:putative nuclease HARBI1 [Gouania willdenowi]|uniref:putative nuclease HARBI1 n=1 Tax=Gouania willdenowi TaxID=441366 RepID=UPI001054525F|nr:putative nuclease HARBI1 [Gouania willdenowi]